MARKKGVWWTKLKRTWIRMYDPTPEDVARVYQLVKEINQKNKQRAVANKK